MYNPSSTSPGSSANSGAASIQDVFNSWINSLTKPISGPPVGIATFQQEAASATQSKTIMSVGLAAVVSVIFGLLNGLIGGNLLGSLITTIVTFAISFAVTVGALYIGAKVQGGTGTLEQQAWVQSTYWAPLTILGNIPIIGFIFGIIAFFYMLYLNWLNVQAVHRLDSTKSIIALIIWAVISVIVSFILGAIFVALAIGTAVVTGS